MFYLILMPTPPAFASTKACWSFCFCSFACRVTGVTGVTLPSRKTLRSRISAPRFSASQLCSWCWCFLSPWTFCQKTWRTRGRGGPEDQKIWRTWKKDQTTWREDLEDDLHDQDDHRTWRTRRTRKPGGPGGPGEPWGLLVFFWS